jgi:hypothetical protein
VAARRITARATRALPLLAGLALGSASCALILGVDGDYQQVDGGAGGQGGSGAGDASGPGSCHDAPHPCTEAEDLGAINGDQGSMTVTATGSTSRWLALNVAEISYNSRNVSYRATLTSPPGVDWDLYVYNGTVDGFDCAAQPTVASGDPETVYKTWSDENGVDDSRIIGFEVRWVSGEACVDAAAWTLTVEGHVGN